MFGRICTWFILLGLLMGIFATAIRAEEGFFLRESLPPALSSAWEATFFLGRQTKNGTAFVIAKRPSRYEPDTKTVLTLLTADHVIAGLCKSGVGLCDVVLSASLGFNRDAREYIRMDRHGRTTDEIEVFRRSSKMDVAMLWALMDRDAVDAILPIPFAGCDNLYLDEEIYLIGFPGVDKRTAVGAKVIDRPHLTIRRWSRGYILDRIQPGRWNTYGVSQLNTTADALKGSSGGPALNSRGEYVGLLSQSREQKSKGNPYRGNAWDSPQIQSLLVECWDLQKFLGRQAGLYERKE